jgi:glycosyltransferase involved in cell wall biosynthesis
MAFMAAYAGAVTRGEIVVHEHDLVFRPSYRRAHESGWSSTKLFRFIDWCMWSGFERRSARKAAATLTVTEQDKRLLEWLSGSDRIRYLPRAVDVGDLPPAGTRKPNSVVFLGSYRHQPNTDAAGYIVGELAPAVWSSHPSTHFVFAGPDPPEAITRAAATDPRIETLGFVNDPDELLKEATLFLAPLRFGGGVKVKILHAMALGVPVVTSPIGAEGIEGLVPGVTHLVGTSSSELTRHVTSLLDSSALAAKIGAAGFNAIVTNYSWERVVGRLEQFYSETLQRTP